MAKLVYTSLKAAKPTRKSAAKKKASVTTKRVKGPDGKSLTVHTVDADSRTFGDDISYVFRQNVRKARSENKKIVGLPDRVPAKA